MFFFTAIKCNSLLNLGGKRGWTCEDVFVF